MAADVLEEEYYNLQEENDRYKKLISHEKDNLVSLDREITAAGSRIQVKSAVPGGILKHRRRHGRHREQIRTLENKLNQDTIKFDEVLCSNMDYYEDIAHLLQQKSTVCSIEEKFNSQLAAQRGIMEKLEEKSTLAFNQGLEAQTRMRELEVGENIEVETKIKMKLKILIDHDAKLYSFMEKKFKEFIPLKEDEDSKTRKKQQEYQSGVKRLEMYMQGHSTLVEVTGEKELRHIGHLFIQNEQKNFALINYINKLHGRRNELKSSTDTMKSNILFLEHDNDRHDEQAESHLKDAESDVEKHSCLADSLEKQCVLFQETLDRLKAAITVLVSEMTQEAAVVTFDNISHFISVLEENITDLLIYANNVKDKQLPPQNLLLANSDLLPEGETGVADLLRSRLSLPDQTENSAINQPLTNV